MTGVRPRQLALDLPVRAALGRADFFISPANELALAQIDVWPDWPDGRLALCGPRRSGKTHLLHVWAEQARATILNFADLAGLDPTGFPPDAAIAVEDADRMVSRDSEEGLFHFCNHLHARGTLLTTSRMPPANWTLRLPDLASRMRIAGVARLEPPDDALLAAVLAKLFDDRQIQITPGLIGYLLLRIERSFDAAEAVVQRLDRAGLAAHRPITERLAAEVLRDR